MRYERYTFRREHKRYERHTATIVPSVVLVASATITAGAASPQPNTAPVQFSVAVLPANAKDKTGVWSISTGGNIAAIDQTGKVTPVGGATIGNIVVKWVANDASKTETTMNYRFEAPVVP